MEGSEQRSVTQSDLYFDRSILAVDWKIDVRPGSRESGGDTCLVLQMRADGDLNKDEAEELGKRG